ncbi:hypothetical protein LINPERHAP1_LOCUS23504 [Linum perenne]
MRLRRSLGSRRCQNSSLMSANRRLCCSNTRRLVRRSCLCQMTMRIRRLALFFALLCKFTSFTYYELN